MNENVKELLESALMSSINMEEIDDEINQLYGRAREVFIDLILHLYEHYKKGECYVPHIADVDPNRKLWCHRRDVEMVLDWIRGALFDIDYYEKEGRFKDEDDTVYDFVRSCVEDDIEGIDITCHFRKIQEAIRCIRHELKKKCEED